MARHNALPVATRGRQIITFVCVCAPVCWMLKGDIILWHASSNIQVLIHIHVLIVWTFVWALACKMLRIRHGVTQHTHAQRVK